MGRLRLSVLVLALSAFASCGRDLPQTLLIDPTLPADLEESVWQAIDIINAELGQALLEKDVLFFGGFSAADDRFAPEKFQDDRHVVYNVAMETPEYREINGEITGMPLEGSTYGYGTYGDVLIFTFTLPQRTVLCASCGKCADIRDHVVLHELGHFIGMGHTDDPFSVMFPFTFAPIISFNDTDRRAFCEYQSCIAPP